MLDSRSGLHSARSPLGAGSWSSEAHDRINGARGSNDRPAAPFHAVCSGLNFRDASNLSS